MATLRHLIRSGFTQRQAVAVKGSSGLTLPQRGKSQFYADRYGKPAVPVPGPLQYGLAIIPLPDQYAFVPEIILQSDGVMLVQTDAVLAGFDFEVNLSASLASVTAALLIDTGTGFSPARGINGDIAPTVPQGSSVSYYAEPWDQLEVRAGDKLALGVYTNSAGSIVDAYLDFDIRFTKGV